MGFARVEGPANNFRGMNIHYKTGERTGNGANGLKASGILMVNGILYLWVRNAHDPQLAWSRDHGGKQPGDGDSAGSPASVRPPSLISAGITKGRATNILRVFAGWRERVRGGRLSVAGQG